MTRRPTAAVEAWFVREGFRPCGEKDGSYELTYAHSSGFGWVTLRFWPHDYGWDAIVRSDDRSVSLGTCQSLDQMDRILGVLRSFSRGRYVDAYGQRAAPAETLVERSVVDG